MTIEDVNGTPLTKADKKAQVRAEVNAWIETHPKTNIALQVALVLTIAALGAFGGYRRGKFIGAKAGVQEGKVAGYAIALSDMDVTSADVAEAMRAKRDANEAILAARVTEAVPA